MTAPSWRTVRRPAGNGAAQPRLTGLGAVLVVLVPAVLGALLDGLFGSGYGILTGIGFAAGCFCAAIKTRTRDLPIVMVTPPLLFVVAVGIAETVRSWGGDSWLRDQVVAVTIALAGDAFWIIASTGATVVIAAVRWFSRAPRSDARGGGRASNARTAPPRSR